MPKVVTKGSGITAREERIFDLNDQKSCDEWLAAVGADAFWFADTIEPAAAWAKAVLQKAKQERRRCAWDDDTPESYARRLDHYIGMANGLIKRGNADCAARIALEVGKLAEQARMKFAWEAAAIQGMQGRTRSKKGADKTNRGKRDDADAWKQTVYKRVRRLIDAGKTEFNIAELVRPHTATARRKARGTSAVRAFIADVKAGLYPPKQK